MGRRWAKASNKEGTRNPGHHRIHREGGRVYRVQERIGKGKKQEPHYSRTSGEDGKESGANLGVWKPRGSFEGRMSGFNGGNGKV